MAAWMQQRRRDDGPRDGDPVQPPDVDDAIFMSPPRCYKGGVTQQPQRLRGRPPDAGLDRRVLDAVVAELAAVGVRGLSINSVAARAGVAKRSITARWPQREGLVLEGLNWIAAGLVPPHTGDLRSDLTVLASRIAEVMEEPRRSILASCVAEFEELPQYYEAFRRESVDRCIAAVEDVLHDGARRGELRPGVDMGVAADCFVGAVVGSRSFLHLATASADQVDSQLVDVFVRGLASPTVQHSKEEPR
jgi:AcrR family transcriptional regulator